MNRDDQVRVIRTRRALNSLQYSPNGKDIVGLSPRKTDQSQTKKGLSESKNKVNQRDGLKKRTSISLPNICGILVQNANKSVTSTPSKHSQRTTSTSNTPTKQIQKEIPIIAEEKENPNILIENRSNQNVYLKEKTIKSKETLVKCHEIEIQCNKSDEDMLTSSSVEQTPYWKLLAHKRFKSLLESKEENYKLNETIADLDKKNEALRQKNQELIEVYKEYDEIKKQILEMIEEEDGENNDSGYEKSQINLD